MKIENNKIIECTDNELYHYWLTRGWDDIYTYPTYKRKCIELGTKIIN